MTEKKVNILNRLGLHARPAAMLVRTAGKYKSQIMLSKNGLQVDGKSILGVMMLAAECGSEITIQATGTDSEEAVAAITALIESKFEEE